MSVYFDQKLNPTKAPQRYQRGAFYMGGLLPHVKPTPIIPTVGFNPNSNPTEQGFLGGQELVECLNCSNTVNTEGSESVELSKASYMAKMGKCLGFLGDRFKQHGQWVRVSWDEQRCTAKGIPLMPKGFKHRCDHFKPVSHANKPAEAPACTEPLIGQWGDAEISAYLTKLDELTAEGIPLQQAERLAGQFVDSRQHQPKF
jgi:hypothetical protein